MRSLIHPIAVGILSVVVASATVGSVFAASADQNEVEAIQTLLLESYIHGAFNELDPEAMKQGFHEDFAIFSADGESIRRYPIANWVENTAKRKSSADFDPAKNKWEHEFVSVRVNGRAASVELNLSRNGKLVYTDYLSLLKFDSGWRVVAKVYHQYGR